MTNAEYRKWLIEEILKMQTKNQFEKLILKTNRSGLWRLFSTM